MVTHYWVDSNFDGVVDNYCHKVRWGEGCPPINKLAIDRFRFGLQWCLAKAVEMGLDIAITPHLDDGLEMGEWWCHCWIEMLLSRQLFDSAWVCPAAGFIGSGM